MVTLVDRDSLGLKASWFHKSKDVDGGTIMQPPPQLEALIQRGDDFMSKYPSLTMYGKLAGRQEQRESSSASSETGFSVLYVDSGTLST